MENDQTRNLLKATQSLFFLNAAVWVVFGVLGLFEALDGGSSLRWVLSILMFANAAVMVWLGVVIGSGRKQIFFLAILYMALNVVLSITDQFGWIDALILLLNLIMLGLLFITRTRINRADRVPSGDL